MDAAAQISGRKLGDFVVREAIGEGGFGVVHRAEQPLLGREAVIKLLHTRLRASTVVTQRFLREARLASRLDHPYAAHIYAFGVEADGLMWIAMELVHGTPLNRLLATKGPLPLVELVPLIERIAEVVHAAHEQGIVHRDIKPGNVMVISRAGKLLPKLLDLGVAKTMADAAPDELTGMHEPMDDPAMGSRGEDDTIEYVASPEPPAEGGVVLTQLGQLMGSPPYMAPEIWNGAASADARADLYALGILTYEALVGARPFQGKSLPALGVAHTHLPVPPVGDRFPAALDDVFRQILAKQPEDRYPDAIAFAAAFRTAAGMATQAEELPRLDDALRTRVVVHAPQPIAETVAELDAAHNAHQARDALGAVVSTIVRLLGLIALACRARTGPGGGSDAAEVVDLVRALRRRGLSDSEWLDLARRLAAPFVDRRELYPIPALVDLLAGDDDRFAALLSNVSITEPGSRSREGQVLDALRRGLPALSRLLAGIAFLDDHPLLVGAERWTGVRRARGRDSSLAATPAPGQVWLIDHSGRMVVPLSPLVQAAPPAPGAAPELFLLEGPGRQGARLTAHPAGFERHDPAPWSWLADTILGDDAETVQTADEHPPYRGLEPFTTADAEQFVGRTRDVEAVVNLLRTRPMVTIVGASGAGKSSLVQAGVIPALPAGWRAITVRPGAAPLQALDARLARDNIDPDAMADGEVLVVVVDQLEELFTQCLDPDERVRYASRLSRLAASPDGPVRVVLTLRDDFLVRASELAPLRERLSTGMLLLSTPPADELKRLLVEPAERAGYDFDDPTLPERMVAEVVDLPGALPLLSFTAARMWELRDRQFKRLTTRVYDAIGGVAGALAQHAERTLAELTQQQQGLVREIFRNLITADGTRAALGRNQLAQLLGDAGPAVAEKLIAARLLVASDSEQGHERIEIVHESLLTAWPRVVAWRQEDAEGVRLRDQLRAATRQWVDRGRPRGLLWRDDALSEYRAWRARWPGRLTDDEEAFARTSLADADRSRRLRRRAIAAVIGVLMAMVVVLAWFGHRASTARREVESNARKERERVIAQFVDQGRLALLQGDAARAIVWLHEARKQGSRDPALPYMLALASRPLAARLRSLEGHTEPIRALAASRDGRFAATVGADGSARVWEISSGKMVALTGARDALEVVAFDPSGERVLTAGVEGVIRVYSIGGQLLSSLDDSPREVFRAEWAPDGKRVAAVGSARDAAVWDVASGKLVHRLEPGTPVSAIAIGPDGTLVTGTFGAEVTLWDARSGAKQAVLAGHRDGIRAIAFSGDGRWLATTSLDGVTIVWDVTARGKRFPALQGHNGWVERPAFSPDGRWLATVSPDRTGKLWSLDDGSSRCVLEGHTGAVRSVAFDRTGRRMVTASEDGKAIIWDTGSCAQLASLQGHSGRVVHAMFAGDDTVITAGSDGTAKLWRASSGPLQAILAHTSDTRLAGYSPDGSRIATYSNDGTIRLWSRDGRLLASLASDAVGVNDVAWSRDGRRLASGGDDGTVRVWDVPGATQMQSWPAHTGPAVVAFSPDATRLWSGGGDGTLRRWDATTGATLGDVHAHDAPISVVRFSPDGSRVISGDWTGVGKLWDGNEQLLDTLPMRGRVLAAAFSPDGGRIALASTDAHAVLWTLDGRNRRELRHDGAVFSIRFDRDGTRIVTASEDGKVRIWDGHTGELRLVLEGHASKVFGAAFSPDGQLVVSAGNDRTARIWDARTGREIARLSGHQLAVDRAEFDPAGTHVVTGGFDRNAMVWSLERSTASIEETERLLRCAVPFTLRNDRLEPVRPEAAACDPE